MLDQTFSAQNFLLIADEENRRGANVNSDFFPSVKTATDAVKLAVQNVRDFRRNHAKPYSQPELSTYGTLLDARAAAKKVRDDVLERSLSQVAKAVSSKSYSIDFTRDPGPKGKAVCTLSNGPEHYYATKLISRNLRRLYKVKQANKNLISSQLSAQLADSFPYYVARFDISEFYESIDQVRLMEKLKRDLLLSATSLKLINGVLEKYSGLAGTPAKGLPRGIGISAYLAELYMREFDSEIRGGNEVVYYARYVDDIVVLFAPTKGTDIANYQTWIADCVAKYGLQINPSPFKSSYFSKDAAKWDFEYLGYKFDRTAKTLNIMLSDKKFARYEARIRRCFQQYHATRQKSQKAAHRLLVQRIRFLTGNTQLHHSKQNAFVGIFYSNPHLTSLKQLNKLDALKKKLSSKRHISTSLKAKLDALSFVNGYEQRAFRNFSARQDLERIVNGWKYVQ